MQMLPQNQATKMMSCENEHAKPTRMRVVKGHVPRDLCGTYFKVGPALDRPLQHPLDGDGYITKITFHGNGIAPLYQGKYVNTPCRRMSRPANAFGGPMLTSTGINNPSNTNVTWWNNKLITLYDGGAPYTLDPTSLEVNGQLLHFQDGVPLTTGSTTLDDPLRKYGLVGDCVNAHPKTDAQNNLVCMELKFCAFPSFHTRVCFHTLAPNQLTASAKMNMVWINGVAYMHDFILTDEHIIFVHHPLALNQVAAATQWNTIGIARALEQDPSRPSTLYIINRRTGETTQVRLDLMGSFFITHHVHARRRGPNKLELTSVCYPSYMEAPGTVHVMTVCLEKRILERAEKIAGWVEFPVPSQGGWYGTCATDGAHPLQSICHIDDFNNQHLPTLEWGRWWGEPALANDYVMAFSQDTNTAHTTLNIFDRSLAKHICELEFNNKVVPIGLHGMFIPNAVL